MRRQWLTGRPTSVCAKMPCTKGKKKKSTPRCARKQRCPATAVRKTPPEAGIRLCSRRICHPETAIRSLLYSTVPYGLQGRGRGPRKHADGGKSFLVGPSPPKEEHCAIWEEKNGLCFCHCCGNLIKRKRRRGGGGLPSPRSRYPIKSGGLLRQGKERERLSRRRRGRCVGAEMTMNAVSEGLYGRAGGTKGTGGTAYSGLAPLPNQQHLMVNRPS